MNPYQVVGVVVAGVATVAGIGASWQAVAARRDRRRYPPPGELIDVGGHRLHLLVAGAPTDAPTVVLEAGMASMSANWAWVQQELAAESRVVSYDRAGLGWSDPGRGSRDAATSAEELHTALRAAGIGPPYVLAGHSYGGLVVRMFADRYPGADGLRAWQHQSRDQVNATRGLGDLPLVVLSVTEQDRYAEVLTRLQDDLVSLSSNSRHRTVTGATHYTLVSEQRYAAVVSDAVRTVSAAATGRSRR